MIRSYILLLLLTFTTVLSAQNEDVASWTSFNISHAIQPRLAVSGIVELRTKNDLGDIDRWAVSLGGTYNALSFLKLNVGYETQYRTLSAGEWGIRHRYYLGGVATVRYDKLKISLREHLQQTNAYGVKESHLRSRLKFAYASTGGSVTPYFSVEVFQGLSDTPFWKATRTRYRPGLKIAVTDNVSFDAFYCYQREAERAKNIAGLVCNLAF